MISILCLLRVSLLFVSPMCCLGSRPYGRRKKNGTFYFSAEDFDRKDWKYLDIFDSGPIGTNESETFSLDRDHDRPKQTSSSSSIKNQQCKAHKLPKTCRLLSNCHEVICKLNVLGNSGSMKIAFPPISASLTANVQIIVKKAKVNTYHIKAGKFSSGVVIKELGYKVGNMQTKIEFSFSLKTLSRGKRSVKMFATTRGRVSGFTKYRFRTKFLHITTSSKLSKNTGNKEKQGQQNKFGGPCGNIKLPSICGITPDCLRFSCALRFIGQQISLSFKINKCHSPITMSAGIDIPALKIKWSRKLRSGMLVAIPGYGVSVAGISGGVLIDVMIKVVRSRLVLMITNGTSQIEFKCAASCKKHVLRVEHGDHVVDFKHIVKISDRSRSTGKRSMARCIDSMQVKLIVGAKVGFMHVFPVNFKLLKLRLPMKIKGCDKSKSDYTNTTLPTEGISNIPSSTAYPASPGDIVTEYPTTTYPTNSRDEYQNPTNVMENPGTYNIELERENEYEAARHQTSDNHDNNEVDYQEEDGEEPEQPDLGIAPPMSTFEQLQPLEGDA